MHNAWHVGTLSAKNISAEAAHCARLDRWKWARKLYHAPTSKPTVPKKENDQDVGHSAERRQLPLFLPNFRAPSRKNESARKGGHHKEIDQTHGIATPKMLVEEQRQNGRKCGSLNWHLLPCVLSQLQAP